MKKMILSSLLSLSILCFAQAQEMSTSDTQVNLTAKYPSGKMRAYNHVASTNLNLKDGTLNIVAYNKSFQFTPALHTPLKKEVENAHKYPATKIKARITNIDEIDFSKEGQQSARVIGRFIYNDVATTFYERAQITIENGEVLLTLGLEVFLADYEIEGADKDDTMFVAVMTSLSK